MGDEPCFWRAPARLEIHGHRAIIGKGQNPPAIDAPRVGDDRPEEKPERYRRRPRGTRAWDNASHCKSEHAQPERDCRNSSTCERLRVLEGKLLATEAGRFQLVPAARSCE